MTEPKVVRCDLRYEDEMDDGSATGMYENPTGAWVSYSDYTSPPRWSGCGSISKVNWIA